MASSSSSSDVQQKHQVFLSFRGEDTRYNFTDHLYAALDRKGIDTFIDDGLTRGQEISQALLTAIQESKISIIVLSKNYASSSWCLDELSMILDCKKKYGQKVVPIFYHVDPSDVRNQKGSFEEAFAKHQEGLKDRTDKVERWSAAMKEVGGLSGYHIQPQMSESRIIVDIVKDISKKLMFKSLCDTKHLIGIDSRIEQIELSLCFGSKDVRIVGIWGMGGIGKTTIAKVVYDQFFNEFDSCVFLANVKENYGRGCLREDLFSKILEDRNLNIGTSSLSACIKDRIRQKKVLIVLDDVDDSMQLDLLPEKNCYGPGSRIIITSRDKQVLREVVDEMYKVEGLIYYEALQLFCLYAFKQRYPEEEFTKLSDKVVHYAKGVPLALRVLGSTFYGRAKLFWEGELKKLKEILNPKIDDVLKISLDGLDDEVKDIFLDIACFFKGKDRDYVEDLLKSCYISGMCGINILFDKSFITISNNMLEMHDLLQQMAWNFVRQESKEPGKRSRLWTHNDIYHVLNNNTGTGRVTGIFLDMSKTREINLRPETFANMCNLKFLKFFYSDLKSKRTVYISQKGLKSLPDNLSYLHWDAYPSKSLPSNFCAESLVELSMPNSRVKRLWNGVQNLVHLKWLDLSHSQYLVQIPDVSQATKLESMKLVGCTNLVEVPSSIQYLNKLWYLDVKGCQNLGNFPSNIRLRSLRILILTNCSNVTEFPEISRNIEILYLSGTAIQEVPSSIEYMVDLILLDLDYCKKLNNLPSSISKLKSLASLGLKNCSNITMFPKIPPNLVQLDLSGTGIKIVAHSCYQFWKLACDSCATLKRFQELISIPLLACDCYGTLKAFQELISIPLLRESDLSRINFKPLPTGIKQLWELQRSVKLTGYKLPLYVGSQMGLGHLDAHYSRSLELVSHLFIDPNDISMVENTKNSIDLVKTRLKIQQKAVEDFKLYHEGSYQKSSFSVCFPGGSTIPEWFSHRTGGSSIITCLSPYFQNDLYVGRMFLGFALWVHVVFPNFSDDLRGFNCRCNFKTYGDGCDHCYDVSCFLFPWDEYPRFIASDQKLICYNFDFYRTWYSGESKYCTKRTDDPKSTCHSVWDEGGSKYYTKNEYHPKHMYHLDIASFEFSICNSEGSIVDSGMVKECAVHLLSNKDVVTRLLKRQPSESDAEEYNHSSHYDLMSGVSSQDFVEPMVEDGTTTTKRPRDDSCYDEARPNGNFSSNDEVESCPKRLR